MTCLARCRRCLCSASRTAAPCPRNAQSSKSTRAVCFPSPIPCLPQRFTAIFHSGATAYYDALALMALHKDGDAIESTVSGASFFIKRAQGDEHDERQFSVEIRYFWQQRTLQKQRGTEMVGSNDQHKVILWVRKGKLLAGQYQSLLEKDAAYLYADTIDHLVDQVACAVSRALDRGYEATPAAHAAFRDALENKAMREYRELAAVDQPLYERSFLKGFDGLYIPWDALDSNVSLHGWLLGNRNCHEVGVGALAYRRQP